MTRIHAILGLTACLLATPSAVLAQQPDQPNTKSAPEELLGAYTIVSGEKYGDKEPADRLAGTTVRFADDAIIVLDKEKKEVYAQTYKVDTTSTPWKITMTSKITPYTPKGKDAGGDMVAKGLIEKKGDTVRLIYALPGGEMPTEFKTKEKQLMFVMVNERKSK